MNTKKKKKTNIVYKIFRFSGRILRSWTPPVGCSFAYSRTDINKPEIPGSKFFVFKTLKAAMEYDSSVGMSRRIFRRIFRCRATGLCKQKLKVNIFTDRKFVEKFWEHQLSGVEIDYGDEVMFDEFWVCRSLKLLNEVKLK